MKISFTFEPKNEIQEQLKHAFSNHSFHFEKGSLPPKDTEIWVTYGEDVREESIQDLAQLKWISVASAGVEKLPLTSLAQREILVTNARGIHKTPMTESIIGHILALYRNLPAIYHFTEAQKWEKPRGSRELRGSKAVIVGPGAIGAEVARILQAFGVEVVGCNRSGDAVESVDKTVSFEHLLEELADADIVLSLVPSTKQTRHLFTKEHFTAMKSSAIFMNFGRGDVVAEEILASALKTGAIGQAVLDVFEVEPLPSQSPLWGLDNVIVSPHISSHSDYYVERAMEIFSRNLTKWEKGESALENKVDLNLGY